MRAVFAATALALTISILGCGGRAGSDAVKERDDTPLRPDPAGPPPEGMALVRGGTYTIGSEDGEPDERPVHDVRLDPFYIDAKEVTNAEFARFVDATGYSSEGQWQRFAGRGRERFPVTSVTWNDAMAYAKWAGKRLPTESEWEAAARGGLERKRYPNGDTLEPGDATFGVDYEFPGLGTTEVGSHPPNGYGLYDVAGNVWEWCSDYYAADAYTRAAERDPQGPERGAARVVRGGSWNDQAVDLRVANRLEMTPTIIGPVFGFRCAKTP